MINEFFTAFFVNANYNEIHLNSTHSFKCRYFFVEIWCNKMVKYPLTGIENRVNI